MMLIFKASTLWNQLIIILQYKQKVFQTFQMLNYVSEVFVVSVFDINWKKTF